LRLADGEQSAELTPKSRKTISGTQDQVSPFFDKQFFGKCYNNDYDVYCG